MESDHPAEMAVGTAAIHRPEAIAERVGGISVKSLAELLRKNGLETTTLGFTEPSKRGGPPRRVWGMTDAQLQVLLEFRRLRTEERARSH